MPADDGRLPLWLKGLAVGVAGLALFVILGAEPRPAAAPGPASSGDEIPCDPVAAKLDLERALNGGALRDVSVYQDRLTVTVDEGLWARMDLPLRLGIVATLDCAVAGPGQRLTRLQFIAPTGRVLAEWDGIRRRLDVRS